MKTFVCQVCGHVAFDEAPVDCPVCRMPIENFENDPEAVKKPADPGNLSETEKKHIPLIFVNKECGLDHGDVCTNVHIKVGEIEHVMETEHFINFIDLYIDKKYLTRTILTPRRQHPAAGMHLNINEGKLTVVGNCNVHGNWISKINLDESGQ